MISILIFILAVAIGSTLGIRLGVAVNGGSFIPKALKPKKKVPNYEFIEQADREIFGIEPNGERPQDTPKEIAGLAGYRTRLRKDHDGDLECQLINARGAVIETGYVYAYDYADPRTRMKSQLSASQLEKKVTEKFDKIIKEHKAKLASEAAMNNLIEKYNNKAVEQ